MAIQDTVKIKEEIYTVEPITDMSLFHLMTFLQEGTNANILIKSNAAAEIKEAIIPTLPDSIISINRNGKYIFHISAAEINQLTCNLIVSGYKDKLILLQELEQSESVIQDISETTEMIDNLSNYLKRLIPEPLEPIQQNPIEIIETINPSIAQPVLQG